MRAIRASLEYLKQKFEGEAVAQVVAPRGREYRGRGFPNKINK